MLEVGCFWNNIHIKEVWVIVMGLPLHLYDSMLFKKLRDWYGGFVGVDGGITVTP